MSSDEKMNAALRRWRLGVRSKERRVFRLEERIEMRLAAIEKHLRPIRIEQKEWEFRQFTYYTPDNIKFTDADWRTINVGDNWGGPDVSAYFRRTVIIPEEMDGKPVMMRMYLGGDSLVTVNGVPHAGLDIFRNEFPLTPKAKAGESFDIQIESYVYWHGGEPNIHTIDVSEICTVDPEIHQAYWDFRAAVKMFELVGLEPVFRSFLEKTVWDPLKDVPIDEEDTTVFKGQLLQAQARLKQLFYESTMFHNEGLMHMVGHSHLDVVFMWTYAEFVRKVGRTHSTMLRLMETYPEFKFSQSQAKIYADMKEHYPDLFAQVKQRVAEGRWEPLGAFWVEPDCNLISGESFVRQVMQGQQFWQREFGYTSHICWQPDVFGVSWALPQILKRSGVDYFLTNKMVVWNDTNKWTKNTFWWESPDGSRVLCVVPPGHFIGTVDPDQMMSQWNAFSDRGTVGESLYAYGWGDGGGGCDTEMLECGRRYANIPGMVPTVFANAQDAFTSIKDKALENNMPVVNDELYLEAHRGTYTSRGRLKRLNRRGEFLLREVELFTTLAWLDGTPYPAAPLTAIWQEFLTNQFHDSLPGTHIPPVYLDLQQTYREIFAQLDDIRATAAAEIIAPVAADPQALVVFNEFLHERNDHLAIPVTQLAGKAPALADGTPLTTQAITTLEGDDFILTENTGVPAVGCSSITLVDSVNSSEFVPGVTVGADWLENEYLRATFNTNGEVISLWDKEANREVIAEGQVGNRFQMYQDTPGKYDAWDIVASYKEHEYPFTTPGTLTIDEEGPLRASLLLQRPCRRSAITQRISLEAGARCLKFETKIDWVERQTLLKVAFPVEINCHEATYDIAYGNMTRPTHRNTSTDEARFEVPAHQWMDMSEGSYGVSLLNDCKYGHEAYDNVMRLTLLKGPIFPDPNADEETHFFTYSLYPHIGTWREAGTIQQALNLNYPCYTTPVAAPVEAKSWITCDSDHVTLEAVKCAEDSQHLIVRIAEQHNSRQPIQLSFDRPISKAWSTNLMETIESELPPAGSTLYVNIKPYEVVTLRIELAK